MITKFSIYERVNPGPGPEINDYVVCREVDAHPFAEFISNNIGQIIHIGYKEYIGSNGFGEFVVKYDNIPDELKIYAGENDPKTVGVRRFKKDDIIYWADDIKDLKSFLRGKTFDL